MVSNFTVRHRNPGHWDILIANGRAFRVRGGPGKYWISDERRDSSNFGRLNIDFKTIDQAMLWICNELMFEIIATESQEVTRIEDWNV